MNNSFEPAMSSVLDWEGGEVNNPEDPGGRTKFGISKRAYPKMNIDKLTKDRARKIYRRDYWTPAGCDELPAGLDLFVFDTAVNCGVKRAMQWLQQAVGSTPDGIWGPKTKDAAGKADLHTALLEMAALRGQHYGSLETFSEFGLGWMRRLVSQLSQAQELVKAK